MEGSRYHPFDLGHTDDENLVDYSCVAGGRTCLPWGIDAGV